MAEICRSLDGGIRIRPYSTNLHDLDKVRPFPHSHLPHSLTKPSEIFQRRHGEVGVAAASALVSGLGNLGSVTTVPPPPPPPSLPTHYTNKLQDLRTLHRLGLG